MISKLPRWAWLAAGVLAFIAGSINAVGFLGYQHQGITHLTGSTTLLGIALGHGELAQAWHLLSIILAFLAGCITSGAIVRDSTLRLGRRYGAALALESLILFLSASFLRREQPWGLYLAASACGLQNGMVSTFSGAVLRTTHMSGAFTDLGILIGEWLRGVRVDARRIRLYGYLIAGFLLGGVAGTFGYARFGAGVLYFPAAVIGVVGLSDGIYRHRQRVLAAAP